ncbi:MAG: DUF726 domain-containing protein [Lentisphaeria bacterium]|nr:DUF726 domain-containing protein [Lentisphaeria bacterium]
MKSFRLPVLICLLIITSTLRAEVCFVPGWYNEWINYRKHTAVLAGLFPGENIRICKWDSNRFWKNAKKSAGEFADEFSGEVLAGNSEEITLIGHSLGGRIVLDCIARIARQKKQVRQVILLGTAGVITPEDLQNCRQVSRLPVINIFCTDDNMLKLFYAREGVMPLGLCGLPQQEKHFRQYRMRVPDHEIKLLDVRILSHKNVEFFRETAAHLAKKYVQVLGEVLQQQTGEAYIDLAVLEKIASRDAVKKDLFPGFVTIDEWDGWKLDCRRIRRRFRIASPVGRTFYFDSEYAARRNFSDIRSRLIQAAD